MAHIQTQAEWETEMSLKILSFIRNELYMDLRFLGVALSELVLKPDNSLGAFATDGSCLYFSTEQLMRVFKKNASYLDRAYLHTVLHCIFSHLWIAGNRERNKWNLACDIVVEYVIDRMDKPCTRRILSWHRQNIYQMLQEEKQGVSAATVYRMLHSFSMEEQLLLAKEFYTDDHCYWPKSEDSRAKQEAAIQNHNKWNKIARQSKLEQEQRGDENKEGEELFASQISAEKSRRSYRDFLQKFSVMREELHTDLDEFDLNYYTYGLKLYQNMPLIEPLESREEKKILEFVIALDTSYSTSGALIENFLNETLEILLQKNSFFRESKIHVIQCDNQVQTDTEIRNEADIHRLMEQFCVCGGGGTDFRPVFSYVDELLAEGKIKNLGGLLYFTDGKGIYPKKKPAYRTAFLFLEDYENEKVPPWAIRLQLSPDLLLD